MLGGFAVGKTSLVQRFVTSMFSERYQTTIGVTIEKRAVAVEDQLETLMIWDLFGEDDFQSLRDSFLRGAEGCLFVVDGTRARTLQVALQLAERVDGVLGPAPRAMLLNKSDLIDRWELDARELAALEAGGWRMLRTSAKSGENVERAFGELLRAIGRAAR